jgi:hypothetical protein
MRANAIRPTTAFGASAPRAAHGTREGETSLRGETTSTAGWDHRGVRRFEIFETRGGSYGWALINPSRTATARESGRYPTPSELGALPRRRGRTSPRPRSSEGTIRRASSPGAPDTRDSDGPTPGSGHEAIFHDVQEQEAGS